MRVTETGRARAPELTDLEVVDELGRGAFTTVHRAVHDGCWYAVKRPLADPDEYPAILASFHREAALLACAADPGVVEAHASGLLDGVPALVLEHLPGGSLADQLGAGAPTEERVVALAAQLARALAAAHRAGLVHRDVKPGNIMIAADGAAKLIDFGLAQLGRPADPAGDRAVGTFLYASPEQSGMLKRPVDGRSDLYSLGVVLYECLTGRLPFESSDVGELLRLHLTAPVPDPAVLRPGLAPALAEVVLRLLQKDPDDRYPDAAALLDGLRACPGGSAEDRPAAATWPLIGRSAERDRLARRWERARAGHGGMAVLRGRPGAGRTRLAEQVAADAGDVPVLWATCRPDETQPLAAVREAVQAWESRVRRLPAARRAEAESRLAAAEATGGPALTGGLHGGRDENVIAAYVAYLADLARGSGGLLLVLDDAHLLDPSSRGLLSELAPELAGLPLLVLLTENGDSPVAAEVATAGLLEVACPPLAPVDVADLVASRLPGARVPAELARHVLARSDGLPLTAVGYLERLLDAGLLTPLWGEWLLDTAGADALPSGSGLRDLIAVRLTGLPEAILDCLTAAAVAGTRFRPEILTAVSGRGADEVLAALVVGVDRHMLEPRPGGRYGFVHPRLRAVLLDRLGPDELCRMHAALAVALSALPEGERDAGHAYAVARHYRQAGDAVPDEDRRRSAATAGLRALADQAATEAIGYLCEAVDGDPAPGTELLHALARAYLRAGRVTEAAEVLDRALGGETDRLRRARLLTTRIELLHTVWDDEQALDAVRDALRELGRPMPGRSLLLLLTTVIISVAGGLVRRTRLLYGSVRGRQRAHLEAMTAVLDAGGYAAAVGGRLREAGILALRALYAVNRLGPSPQYVRVYALVGYVAMVAGLRRSGERRVARAATVAAALGDPALGAYVEWMRGCGMLFGGHDDGAAWDRTITRNARWYSPAQLIPGHSALGLRFLLRGYHTEAIREHERGMRALSDPSLALGTGLGILSVMIPAYQGRFGAAAEALERMRTSFPDGTGTRVQRANILTAAACLLLEQGELGPPFEDVIAGFDAIARQGDLMPQHKWTYAFKTHARLVQLRYAPDEERPQRLAAVRDAVRELGRAGGSPLLQATHLAAKASLFQALGDPRRTIRTADEADRMTRELDAPLLQYELMKIRARAMRTIGLTAESDRQARAALTLAGFYGWEQRRRQVRTEFGVDDGGAHRRTVVGGRTVDAGRNRRLEALQEVGAAAATILEPQQLARVALDEMLRILGAERALYFLLDDDGEPVRFAGRDATGDLPETVGHAYSLVRRVVEIGEPIVVSGTDQGEVVGSRSAVEHGLRSILVAPVQFKGRLAGVVYLDSRLAKGVFTDDDVEVLTSMSSHVAVSLETARAAQLHLVVQAAQQQQALAEMLQASLAELTAILEPDQVLRHLCGTLRTQLNADTGFMIGTDGTVFEIFGDAMDEFVGIQIEVPETSGDTPVLLDASGPWAPVLLGAPTVLAVPLRGRGVDVGLVLFGGVGLDDTSRQVAAALAGQGMIAYENARLFSRVQELATTDELTGQHNRRHFYAIGGAMVLTAIRNNRRVAAAMLDIDKFKAINDTYGHGVGDEVIREVAGRVSGRLRHSDVFGRYGGEEFAVVLPDHDGQAEEVAERMRSAISNEPIPTQAGPLPVTISVGLTGLQPGDQSLDELLARADHALYQAKEAGRNRVVSS
ncbi:hypothetical protein Acsp01_29490 [Actinoplanes sp. NBRC 101535]|nr:hypothetical protein Acsp01_29490 [Actinoplanes sp. NBRC 101535]